MIVYVKTILDERKRLLRKEQESADYCCEGMKDAYEANGIYFSSEWEVYFGGEDLIFGLVITGCTEWVPIKFCPFCSASITYKDVKTVRRTVKEIIETIKRNIYVEEPIC